MISNREVLSLLRDQYGLNADEIKLLVGYDNPNYKIVSGGQSYILKLYQNNSTHHKIIEAENNVLLKLQTNLFGKIPNPITTLTGKTTFDSGENSFGRLLSYLEGDLLENVDHAPQLFSSLGKLLGQINKELAALDPFVFKSRVTDWDIQNALRVKRYIQFIPPQRKKLVQYYLQQFEEFILPKLLKCRESLIHGDANDLNIVCKENQISGIFDFGDMVFSQTVNDLAICLAYALMNKDQPVFWASHLILAYHKEFPLLEAEVDILYYLIAARLCISVCHSAYNRTLDPDKDYFFVSEEKAWTLIENWIGISPIGFTNEIKKSIGLNPPTTVSSKTRISKRADLFANNLSLSYSQPIEMMKAAFQYMYDSNGNAYLDTCNNIPHIGHCHPRVTEVTQKQLKILNTNTRYLYSELDQYAEKLLNTFPDRLSKVYLVNSGSAATDLALRMVQTIFPGKKIVVMEQGYHGNTFQGIRISAYKYEGKGGKGKRTDIIQLKLPALNDQNQQQKDLNEALELIQSSHGEIAAFISETILGCAGQYPIPASFMNGICHEIRSQGGLIIADEVQTGFGRVGKTFWAFQLNGITPDIVILGKPIANGHPMGALITSDEIAREFDNGMEFFSSFGGNPVSCAIANTVLDIISEENLQMNAQITGEYLKSELLKIQSNYPLIYDVRGEGLFLGVELRSNNIPSHRDGIITEAIIEQFKASKILVSRDGKFNNTLKIKPPMCFNKSNADQFMNTLEIILNNLEVI